MIPNGIASARRATVEMATSIARLTMMLNPWSGGSLMLMTGMPSRSSSRARRAMTCNRSGTTLTSTISRLVLSSSWSMRTCSSGGRATYK
jgi:hypothetical protein